MDKSAFYEPEEEKKSQMRESSKIKSSLPPEEHVQRKSHGHAMDE